MTSNKALIAEKYDDMIYQDINIAYEAAVGGGVPIFHTINNIKKVDNIKGFMGIINGTTNYILTKMQNENLAMDYVIVEEKIRTCRS